MACEETRLIRDCPRGVFFGKGAVFFTPGSVMGVSASIIVGVYGGKGEPEKRNQVYSPPYLLPVIAGAALTAAPAYFFLDGAAGLPGAGKPRRLLQHGKPHRAG